MRFKLLLCMITLSTAAHAEVGYSTRIGMGHISASGESGTTSSSDQVYVQHYLNPIEFNGTQPYADAEFLRVSSVAAFVAKSDYDTTSYLYKTHTPMGLSGTFYKDDYVVRLAFSTDDVSNRRKTSPSSGYEIKHSEYDLSLGYFIQKNTALLYEHGEASTTYSPVGAAPNIPKHTSAYNGVLLRSLLQLNSGAFYRITAGYNTSSSGNSYAGSLRFYPRNSTYLEYGYIAFNGKDAHPSGHINSAAIGLALNRQWDVRLENTSYASSGTKTNISILSTAYRF